MNSVGAFEEMFSERLGYRGASRKLIMNTDRHQKYWGEVATRVDNTSQAAGCPAFAAASPGGSAESHSRALNRRPVTPSDARDASHKIGGAIISGFSI